MNARMSIFFTVKGPPHNNKKLNKKMLQKWARAALSVQQQQQQQGRLLLKALAQSPNASTKSGFHHSALLLKTSRSSHSQTLLKDLPQDDFVGLTGGQIFHEMMLRHGVKVVFGYPGGAILPVYDAIYNSDYFDFVLPRHEQGAGHMAEGYARVTGNPGVVLVTSGPGKDRCSLKYRDVQLEQRETWVRKRKSFATSIFKRVMALSVSLLAHPSLPSVQPVYGSKKLTCKLW